MANAYLPSDDERSRWGFIVGATDLWEHALKEGPDNLRTALKPYLLFVARLRKGGIPLHQRLHILFTGKLPDGL